MPPNILLVMTDQQRADTLSCLGSRYGRTPHFDALAARGTLFERAFSPIPLCSPARASLWTGLLMHRHGITNNVGGIASALGMIGAETLFVPLRRAGYRLAYVGKWHLGEEDPGLFDVWDGYNSKATHWIERDGRTVYRPFDETRRAVDLLAELDGERPFCLVVSYYPPHPPYDPPPKYAGLQAGSPLPGYFGAVSAIDDCIGELTAAIEARGLGGRTAILSCSDHAQTLDTRDQHPRKRNLFDETVRIPMILALPGGRGAGRRSAAMVSLVDVAPTIRALADLPPATECHGASLLPLTEGGDPPWRTTLMLQNRTRANRDADGIARDERAIRTDRAKLIVGHNRRARLYDLARDPDEREDLLSAPNPPIAAATALADRLEAEAGAIGDTVGARLARTSFQAPG